MRTSHLPRFLAFGLILLASLASPDWAANAPSDHGPLTRPQFERLMEEVSNWGRWGKQDQLGTLNLITPTKRKQAAALVKEGISVSLSRDEDKTRSADNPSPFEVQIAPPKEGVQWAADHYGVSYHGYAHTHLDSLCHIVYQGKLFNGFSASEITANGAGKLSVLNAKNGIFTRAVLLDIPRVKGVKYLKRGTPIFPEDLDAAEKLAGTKVAAGDAILVRTGHWVERQETGPWDPERDGLAGLHASCAPWLRSHGVALLGTDAGADVHPSSVQGVEGPVHLLALNAMGIHILDNADFEALAEVAKTKHRSEFLLTIAPLAVPGGTGSPVNPIAAY